MRLRIKGTSVLGKFLAALLLLAEIGAAWADACPVGQHDTSVSQGGIYAAYNVSAYYPAFGRCLATIRGSTPAEWAANSYSCQGNYAQADIPSFGYAYIRILSCSTQSGASCYWSDANYGSSSGHADNAYATLSCTTCSGANSGWNEFTQACVFGNGDRANQGKCATCEGNPINVATGNKYQVETDYLAKTAFPLAFRRNYNSYAGVSTSHLGPNWRDDYEASLKIKPYGVQGAVTITDVYVVAIRPDGKEYRFTASVDSSNQLPPETFLSPPSYVKERLKKISGGFRYYTETDETEDYDEQGRLLSRHDRRGFAQTLGYDTSGRLSTISDSFGHQLALDYDAQGRVWHLTDPAGAQTTYEYDANGMLYKVTRPATGPNHMVVYRQYFYEKQGFPQLLTGIQDENQADTGRRYATFDYDSVGKATLSTHFGGAEQVTLTYTANGTTVTDALGTARDRTFKNTSGLMQSKGTSQFCTGCGESSLSKDYYNDGSIMTRRDFFGNVTNYDPADSLGRESKRTEAATTTQQRTVTTSWYQSLHLPEDIVESTPSGDVRKVHYGYSDDGVGDVVSKTVTDLATNKSRVTTWHYTNHLVDRIDGPRQDVPNSTALVYSTDGHYNLVQVTDALGHVTQFPQADYDGHGNPKRIIDQNSVETTLDYDERQRLVARTVAGAGTSYEYDGVNQLTKVTLPDNSYIKYTYDDAHRLTDIEDNAGNKIHYTLDALGNRTLEERRDPTGALKYKHEQMFDVASGRLSKVKNAAGDVTSEFTYDDANHYRMQTDAGTLVTKTHFDALNRADQVEDAKHGITKYEFDALDQLTSVTDPSLIKTSYTLNALGNLEHLVSKDTGTTDYVDAASGHDYDGAGNRTWERNADGFETTFTYDALNRITGRHGDSYDQITYSYDGTNYAASTPYGVGRLTGVEDKSGTYTFSYDAHGNLIEEDERLKDASGAFVSNDSAKTTYEYDAADRLSAIGYPTGRKVTYGRNSLGQVQDVTTTLAGTTQALAGAGQYKPFGPLNSWVMGNGASIQTEFDQNYRTSHITAGSALDLTYVYQPLRDNLQTITDALDGGARSQALDHDELNRLTTASGDYGNLAYSYVDPTGDRGTETRDGASSTYAYQPGTHRLDSVSGARNISYSTNNRGLTETNSGDLYDYSGTGNWPHDALRNSGNGYKKTADYLYNFRHQRTLRTIYPNPGTNSASATLLAHYDLQGNLIAETCQDGRVFAEYAYLDGKPLATWTRRRSNANGTYVEQAVSVCATTPTSFMTTLEYGPVASGTSVWHFDSEAVTPPSSTVTTPDSGPSHLDGTLEGTVLPTLVISPFTGLNKAYSFDGEDRGASSSRVNMGSDYRLGLRTASSWTLDVKFKVGAVPSDLGMPLVFREDQRNTQIWLQRDFQLSIASGALAFQYVDQNNADQYMASSYTSIRSNSQHSARVTWDGVRVLLFLDGRPVASNSHAPSSLPLTLPTVVGGQITTSGYYVPFGGIIDEVRISRTGPTIQAAVTNLAAQQQGDPEIFYYVNDHLGTPQKLLDATGAIVWDGVYEPFGTTTVKVQTVFNNLRLPGQYFDAETGLYQNGFRDYDPSIGRYLQSDPIGLVGGISTYSYAYGNPIAFIDPTGLCTNPGGGGYCVQQYIPDATAWGFGGDNRGPTSDGGTYRASQWVWHDENGQMESRSDPGTSTLGPLAMKGNQGPTSATENACEHNCKTYTLTNNTSNGFFPNGLFAPYATYKITIKECDGKVVSVSGLHSPYPNLELWHYGNGAPALLYNYDKGDRTPWNISDPQIRFGGGAR